MRVSDYEKEGKIPELSFANSRKSTLAEFCHTLERACEETCLSRLALSSQVLFYEW